MSQTEQPGLCEQYICGAWKDLAAVAWAEFLANGPGFIFLDFSTMIMIKLDEVIVDAIYIAEEEVRDKCIEMCITPEFREYLTHAVSVYEPDREVIFIAKMPDGSIRDFLVERQPTPPQAFLQMAESSAQDTAKTKAPN